MLRPSIFEWDFLDSIMNDFAQPARARFIERTMKTDIKELEKEYELSIELPGYKKEDIKMELKEGYLNISAKTEVEKENVEENGKFVHKERYSGSCNRKYFVGHDIEQQDIKAKFSDGILKVVIPKKEEKKSEEEKYIKID